MSLANDLNKIDADLKQVKTDTNTALSEKGSVGVSTLTELPEAIRNIPSGGDSPFLGDFKSIYKTTFTGETVGLNRIELTSAQYPEIANATQIVMFCSEAKEKSKQVGINAEAGLLKTVFPRGKYASKNALTIMIGKNGVEWGMDEFSAYATADNIYMNPVTPLNQRSIPRATKFFKPEKLVIEYFLAPTEENEKLEVLVR